MKTNTLLASLLAFSLFIISGCQSDISGSTYSVSSARQQMSITYGTITAMQDVKVEGESGVIGSIAGGILGGVLGNTVGGGRGHNVATAAGALAGAAAGAAIEKSAKTQTATPFDVKLDNGNSRSIVQSMGKDYFQVGQRVAVYTERNGTTRIRPAN